MKTTFIYCLKCPINNDVRYIGKSNCPKKRYSEHINKAKSNKKNTYCYSWINSLLKKNLLPILEIIEECNENNWGERENYWISQFPNLTNLIDGGKFCPMLIPEIAKNHSLKMKGKKSSEETKRKLSEIRKEEWKKGIRKGGWKHTKEFKKKKSKFNKVLWANRTEEEKNKIFLKIGKNNRKKIYQYDLNKEFVKEWDCVKHAELFYCGKNKGHMKRQINKNKPWKGFYWSYEQFDPFTEPILRNDEINN